MSNIMTLHGPDGNDILAERINLKNRPIDDRYFYMLCSCSVPLNIVWRFEIPKHTGYYYGICPDCKEFIGVEVLGKDGRMIIKKDRYLSENFKESIIKKCEKDLDRTERLANYFEETLNDLNQKAKSDAGKPKLTLVPRKILTAIARIREYGNAKYPEGGPDNYKTVGVERYKDAMFRHLVAYLDDPYGVDEESKLPHLWHLACNVAFLCELEDEEIQKGLKE